LTIRINFRRILPGLVILVVGLAFFVLWLILVFVSFFAFFVPGLSGIFYLDLDILLASIVLMAVGGLLMIAGVSGWREIGQEGGWMGGHAAARVEGDKMRPGDRGGTAFGAFVSFLILLFFVENQVRNTGFFTPSFGPLEEALFYGTAVFGILLSLARAAVGRRNPLRPFDALDGLLLLVASVWLFHVFPFDFKHLPDLVPGFLRFAVAWVSDPVGKLALVLVAVGGFASMVYNAVTYALVRSRQSW
jgi:hypothetical protein